MSIYRNPTQSQVAQAVKSNKFLRVLRDRKSGDFYVWPGKEGLHMDVMLELGLDADSAENLGIITSFEDLQKLAKWVAGAE